MLKKMVRIYLLTALVVCLSACGESQTPANADEEEQTGVTDSVDSSDTQDVADSTDSDATPDDAAGNDDPCADAVLDSSFYAWPGAEWVSTCPGVQNIDSAKLRGMYDYAFAPGRNTQSVLVIRNGAIVAEWYAEGKRAEDHVTSWSVAKSFLSAVVGIAVERGDLPSIDEPIATYLPEFAGTDREVVTFRHALQMRSGLAPHEPDNIYFQADQLNWATDRELGEEPGNTWRYQNGDSMLISAAIEAAVGRPYIEYAKEVLFEPIGMTGQWWTDSVGNALGYCCVDATPRNFARFGLLFVRSGEWDGADVIPASWVTQSTAPTAADMPYGMHWWSFENGAYYAALGVMNQSIWVFPYFDLIVLRNGLYEKRGDEYRVAAGSYHDTEEPIEWDDSTFLAPLFEAINDNPFN